MANETPAIKTRPDKVPMDSIIIRQLSGQAEVSGQIVKASRTMVKTIGSHWGKGGSGSAKSRKTARNQQTGLNVRATATQHTRSSPGSPSGHVLRQESHNVTDQERRKNREDSPGRHDQGLLESLVMFATSRLTRKPNPTGQFDQPD